MMGFDKFFENKTLMFSAGAVAFLVAALLILFIFRLAFGRRLHMPGAGRTRQPRLGVVDAFDLDRQRQLVLVRRDNVEHLVMIGGPNDVLIESQIVRVEAREAPRVRDKEPTISPAAPPPGLPQPSFAPEPKLAPEPKFVPEETIVVTRDEAVPSIALPTVVPAAPSALPARAPFLPLPPRRTVPPPAVRAPRPGPVSPSPAVPSPAAPGPVSPAPLSPAPLPPAPLSSVPLSPVPAPAGEGTAPAGSGFPPASPRTPTSPPSFLRPRPAAPNPAFPNPAFPGPAFPSPGAGQPGPAPIGPSPIGPAPIGPAPVGPAVPMTPGVSAPAAGSSAAPPIGPAAPVPGPAPSAAPPVNPQPPVPEKAVNPIDALESLEEEMAKLLGRGNLKDS